MGEPFDPEEEAPMLRSVTPTPAPINTTGKPVEEVQLPVEHLLVSEELLFKAVMAYEKTPGPMVDSARMRSALEAVAPDLFDAGVTAGKKLR